MDCVCIDERQAIQQRKADLSEMPSRGTIKSELSALDTLKHCFQKQALCRRPSAQRAKLESLPTALNYWLVVINFLQTGILSSTGRLQEESKPGSAPFPICTSVQLRCGEGHAQLCHNCSGLDVSHECTQDWQICLKTCHYAKRGVNAQCVWADTYLQ